MSSSSLLDGRAESLSVEKIIQSRHRKPQVQYDWIGEYKGLKVMERVI